MNRPILSASNFGAAILCPGKPALEAQFGEPPAGPDATRGTNLHRYFKTDLPRAGLSAADQDLLSRADKHADGFIVDFIDVAGVGPDNPVEREHEVDLSPTAEYDELVPGHPDFVMTWRFERYSPPEPISPVIAILDLKSGMGDVEEAPSNWQLACYAALIWAREAFTICGVAIIQPDAFGPRVTTALYRAEQMPGVIESIRQGKLATEGPDAPRVSGEEQCRWCRAKARCPEYKVGFQIITADKPLAISTLNNENLVMIKRVIKKALALDAEVTEEIRQRIIAGTIEGWKLRNTGSTRTLTDSLGALRAINAHLVNFGLPPMTAKAFDNTRKPSWGALEEEFAKVSGYTQKRAKDTLKNVLESLTLETPKAQAVVEDSK